jgi:DNA polymerase-3 subunit beta
MATIKLFAAEKDTRTYLNGVCVEVSQLDTRLIATNGHVIAAYRVRQENPAVYLPFSFIVPVELFKKTSAKKGGVDLRASLIGDGRTEEAAQCEVEQAGVIMRAPSIVGRFPDYRRVFPCETSGEVALLSGEYLGLIEHIQKNINGNWGVRIDYNGGGPALLRTSDENFTAAIAPMRPCANKEGKELEFPPHDWVFDYPEDGEL